MQRGTKAELQMLREFYWLCLPTFDCYFCHQPMLMRPPNMTFGHRRHPPATVELTVHHDNRNREDNRFPENLKVAHPLCHRRYHANLRRTHDPADDQ